LPTEPIETPAPRLSLCLATYNRARYLDRYLTHHLTALEASGLDYELVVSDNCSTDETPQILARYAGLYPRMRVARQPRNVGAYPNILTTLHQARGEVVVSIADDDMAIPDQLFAYVRRMIDDPALVMIQAPWFLTDEAKGGAVAGKFYHLEGESRFEQGAYGACLVFAIENHVFPECWLMRRSVLPGIAGPVPRFVFSFFWMLANALAKGDVLFCPEPHVAATVASWSGGQVGVGEAMESWDVYRGGLEWLASLARQRNPDTFADGLAVGGAIQVFVNERMAVAARLQANGGNWANAYQLLRRLYAYGATPEVGFDANDVAVLAALETALLECAQLGASQIVVGQGVAEHVLSRMNPIEGARVIRVDGVRPDDVRRAYCDIGVETHPSMREQDFAYDITPGMDRFPLFSA
jgi:hypothetical protein